MSTKDKLLLIVELLLFNSAWLLLVIVHSGQIWLAGLGIFIIQLAIKYSVGQISPTTLMKILHITGIGIVVDSALTFFGVFQFAGQSFAPLWLMMLWLNFALTLNFSLSWIKQYWVLGTLATACFAVISYFGGFKLGAVAFGYSVMLSLSVVFVAWLLMTPLFFAICHGSRKKSNPVGST